MQEEFWQSVNSCWLAVGIKGAGFAGEGPIQGRVLEVTVQQWHAVLPGECLALNRVVRGQQELRASRSSCSKWVRSARHAAGLFLKQDIAWITNFFVWLFLSTSWLELVHSWTHVMVLVWINLSVLLRRWPWLLLWVSLSWQQQVQVLLAAETKAWKLKLSL